MFASRDKRGLTPLHKAAGLGHQDILEVLLEATGQEALGLQESAGRTVLHYSSLSDNRSLYDWLVEQGADGDIKDSEGRTAQDYLDNKVTDDNLKRKLMEVPEAPKIGLSGRKSPSLKRRSSPVKTRESSPSKQRDGSPRKLGKQTKQKKEDKAMVLINPMKVTKAQIQDWAKNGIVSKLENAVLQGHRDLVTNIGKVWNEEARHFIKKVPELIKQIDEVHELVGKGDSEGLMKIEDTNLILSRDEKGVSPIMKAVEQGNLGLVNLLLSRVPHAAKTTDNHGRTTLHWASKCQDEEIREQLSVLLISKGADKNSKVTMVQNGSQNDTTSTMAAEGSTEKSEQKNAKTEVPEKPKEDPKPVDEEEEKVFFKYVHKSIL